MAWGVGAPQEGTPRLRSIIFRARGDGEGEELGATPRSPALVGWGCAKSSLLTAERLTKMGGVADAEQGAAPPMRKIIATTHAEWGQGRDWWEGGTTPTTERNCKMLNAVRNFQDRTDAAAPSHIARACIRSERRNEHRTDAPCA